MEKNRYVFTVAIFLLTALLFLGLGISSGAQNVQFSVTPGPKPTLSITSNSIYQGQTDMVTAKPANTNDTMVLFVNGLVSAGPSPGTLKYNANTLKPGTYNITAIDVTGNATKSILLSVYALPKLTIKPSNVIVDSGSVETYTISVSGGKGPFIAQLYNITTKKKQIGSSVVIPNSSTKGKISFVVQQVNSSRNMSFNASAIDEGMLGYAFNSTSNTITVNPEIANLTLLLSKSMIVENGTVNVTQNLTGGTPPYTYAFTITNSSTGALLASKRVLSSANSMTYSFSLINITGAVGALSVTVNVTDSSNGHPVFSSTASLMALPPLLSTPQKEEIGTVILVAIIVSAVAVGLYHRKKVRMEVAMQKTIRSARRRGRKEAAKRNTGVRKNTKARRTAKKRKNR